MNVNKLSADVQEAILGVLTANNPPKRIDYPGFTIYFAGANVLRVDINIAESGRNYA